MVDKMREKTTLSEAFLYGTSDVICNIVEGKEDFDDEHELTTPEFSTCEALKGLGIVSMLLDGSIFD